MGISFRKAGFWQRGFPLTTRVFFSHWPSQARWQSHTYGLDSRLLWKTDTQVKRALRQHGYNTDLELSLLSLFYNFKTSKIEANFCLLNNFRKHTNALQPELFWLRNQHNYVGIRKVKKSWRERKQKRKVISSFYSFDRIHQRRWAGGSEGVLEKVWKRGKVIWTVSLVDQFSLHLASFVAPLI